MKKILVVLALAAFASTASATIENSAHDLSKRSGATLGSCSYCHAPHLWVGTNLTGSTPPLWNRNSQASSAYLMWSSQYIRVDTVMGTRSLTCLSCHDGAADLGQVNNGVYTSLGRIGTAANVGTDLTNDHPVGAFYDATNTELVQPAPANGLRIRSGKVECSSCHDPHDTTNGPGGKMFLRTTVDLLCGSCHLK